MNQPPSTPLNIVVGITGGIAAFKAVSVVRAFVREGHKVQVVATDAALRFVGRPTLEAMSRNVVHSDLYEGVAEVRHVAIGQAADLIVIAPATANTIAKLAAGIADDLLGNTVLASTAPIVIAPAMHTEMWLNPATQANIATLKGRGVTIVGPDSGQLTGDDSGPGRLSEPEAIVAASLAAVSLAGVNLSAVSLSAERAHDLSGKRVLVTAGGTREAIDPVRFIGNRSSGRQGVALALAAAARGAEVTLIAANLEIAAPPQVTVVPVTSAFELQDAAQAAAADADIIIMAAAVADYRPRVVADAKIKKEQQGDELTIELVKNPDILKSLTEVRKPGQIIIGFGAETETDPDALLELARAKAKRKGTDFLVVNRVSWSEGFATEDNEVVIVTNTGDIVMKAAGSKASVANSILDLVG